MPPAEPIWYGAPAPVDIVWCRFPQDGVPGPGPKARPALVLSVGEKDNHPVVIVAYGTSQKTDDLHAGEFAILPANAASYTAAGLSYPTKFNLGRTFELDYNDVWFSVAPRPRTRRGASTEAVMAACCQRISAWKTLLCPRTPLRTTLADDWPRSSVPYLWLAVPY